MGLCNRGKLRSVTIESGKYAWRDYELPRPSEDEAEVAKAIWRKALKQMLVNNLNIKEFVLDGDATYKWYALERMIYEEMCHPLFRFQSLLSCLDRYHPAATEVWSLFITQGVASIKIDNHDSKNEGYDSWGEEFDGYPRCARTVVFELIRDYADVLTSQNSNW